MQLLHTADLHIGAFPNRPLKEANIDAFEKIANYAIENDIEYLVVSGDFFERPRLENYEMLRRIYRVLRRLREEKIHVVAIPGSHDSSPRGADTLTLLSEAGLVNLPRYEVVDGLILYPLEIGDLVFYAIPGLRNSMETIYLREGKVRFKKPQDEHKSMVVLAHISVKFAGYDPSIYSSRYGRAIIENERVLSLLPGNTRYVALGHIHFPTPLFDEAEANIAYPGAPVGRDANDLEETHILRTKHGRDRRFLLVDIGDKVFVRSIWDDFNIHVEYHRDYYKGFEDTIKDVKKILKDIPDTKYRVLILNIDSIPVDDINKLMYKLRELEAQKKIMIHLKWKPREEVETLEFTVDELADVEEIEKKAVSELIKKYGLNTQPEKIIELLNILGRRKPEEVSEHEFYEEIYKEIKPIMEDILNGNRD